MKLLSCASTALRLRSRAVLPRLRSCRPPSLPAALPLFSRSRGPGARRCSTHPHASSPDRPSLALPCSPAPQPIPRTRGALRPSPRMGRRPPPRWLRPLTALGDIGNCVAEPKVRPVAKKSTLERDHGQPSVKYAPAPERMVTRRMLWFSAKDKVPLLAPEPQTKPSQVPSAASLCRVPLPQPSAWLLLRPCLPLVP